MPSKFIAILTIICITGLFSVTVSGNQQEKSPYFSNKDIEQYKNPSDDKSSSTKPNKAETRKEEAAKLKEQKEKEYWCKEATKYRKKIEKAQADIKETEKRLSETEGTDLLDAKKKKGIKKSQKDLARAKKQLKEAGRELNKLEDEAHRKGIPPGWLRCQFTW